MKKLLATLTISAATLVGFSGIAHEVAGADGAPAPTPTTVTTVRLPWPTMPSLEDQRRVIPTPAVRFPTTVTTPVTTPEPEPVVMIKQQAALPATE